MFFETFSREGEISLVTPSNRKKKIEETPWTVTGPRAMFIRSLHDVSLGIEGQLVRDLTDRTIRPGHVIINFLLIAFYN